MKRILIGSITVLVLAWAMVVGLNGWINAHRLIAGPENESSFYQNYDPEQVIARFRYTGEGHDGAHSNGASQLIKSIRHFGGFTPRFTMRAAREPELLNALHDDILSRLRLTKANVVARDDGLDGGFTCKYIAGNSVGTITVRVPQYRAAVRRYPVPSGLDDVSLNIVMEETWTRPASETRWWMSVVE